ncbi:hypothetical protein CLAIMM_06847 [Cladophialophora immunda]|nr:hypothetical protein CLAIMM_06847 [Cladophialophora immunda]
MHRPIVFALVSCLCALNVASAPADIVPRQSAPCTDKTIGLYLDGTNFDITYLRTFRLSYANSSAYVGRIKDQSYAEPLIVGALNGSDNSVTFLSIHESPTGFQQMYVFRYQSQPVGFSVPHGDAPQGASTAGFSFGAGGALLHNGFNSFYACQDDALSSLDSYQIYWLDTGNPVGWTCQGPIAIQAGDACSRDE